MAFSEFEVRRISKVIAGFVEKRRPPAHVRDQLDLMFSIEEQSVLLLEKRRLMDGEVIERPFAKATWFKTQDVWTFLGNFTSLSFVRHWTFGFSV